MKSFKYQANELSLYSINNEKPLKKSKKREYQQLGRREIKLKQEISLETVIVKDKKKKKKKTWLNLTINI